MKTNQLPVWPRVVLAACVAFCLTAPLHAAWYGAGVPDGTGGTNINDLANWAGGVIDGDFSTVTVPGTNTFVLTGDLTFTDADAGSRTDVSFSSGSTEITITDPTGLAPGQLVSGTGIPYNTFLIALDGSVGTLSQATASGSVGNYSFFRPAMAFNFGVYGTRATGVSLVINSSQPGLARTVTVSRRLVLSQKTLPRNTVTFSGDIVFNQNFEDAWNVTSESGSVDGAAARPLLTVNGPVNFAAGSGRAIGLNGGNFTVNGPISGSGRFLDPGSGNDAGVLTLTHPHSTFDGGVLFYTANRGELVVDSTNALADTGVPSALGAGGDLSIQNRSVTLRGFTVPQISDRPWRIGGGASAQLINDGAAPLVLNGAVNNPYAAGTWNMQGGYHDYAQPNLVNGQIVDQPYALGVTAAAGVWRLTNAGNSFTGTVSVGNGEKACLQFTSVANRGVPSSLGAGETISFDNTGWTTVSNGIEYVGNADGSTDRDLRLNNNAYTKSHCIRVNGRGALAFSGILTNASIPSVTGVRTRTLVFGGTGSGRFTGTTALADVTDPTLAMTGRVAVTKTGSGRWSLAGSGFDHAGPTDVRAGSLVLEYAAGDHIPSSAVSTEVFIQEGNLTLRGKPDGTTAETFGTLFFGDGHATSIPVFRGSSLTLDANGGDGIALCVGKLEAENEGQKLILFDLSSHAGNTVTVNALGSYLTHKNGILGITASARGTVFIRTPDRYAYAATNGSGQLTAMVPTSRLPQTGGSSTLNYYLTNNISLTGDISYSTLTVDSSVQTVTLAMGNRNLTSSEGRSTLFRGMNDITVTSTGGKIALNSATYWNFLDEGASLRYGADLHLSGSFQYVTWGGPGFTVYSGQTLGARFALFGGLFRMTADQTLTLTGSPLVLSDGGVLEIGADLNGAANGDFSLSCGTANGTLAFRGHAGLSAAGADRTVNLGGAGDTLVWGANGFFTDTLLNEDQGYTFKLSSRKADAMIELRNPIDLNGNTAHGRRRTVEVADGSAAAARWSRPARAHWR